MAWWLALTSVPLVMLALALQDTNALRNRHILRHSYPTSRGRERQFRALQLVGGLPSRRYSSISVPCVRLGTLIIHPPMG